MLKISRDFVTGDHSPDNKPVAFCESGDTVEFDCRNCYDDRLRADGSVDHEELTIDNPATGPLYVNGAEPGDVLKVEILKIKLNGKGYMRQSVVGGAFYQRPGVKERVVREFDVSGDTVKFNDKLEFPIDTMIGVIGTAPVPGSLPGVWPNETPGKWSTELPGDHGGNMDCNKIVEGSTLYLPVNVPGALLSMGDMHALMGDGESMICGLESAGKATVRVSVVKGWHLPTPCLLHKGGKRFSTIQSDPDLMASAKKAANHMLDFLLEYTDLGEYDGGKLLSIKGDLEICHIINDLLTVRMEIDTYILDQYGIQLP